MKPACRQAGMKDEVEVNLAQYRIELGYLAARLASPAESEVRLRRQAKRAQSGIVRGYN